MSNKKFATDGEDTFGITMRVSAWQKLFLLVAQMGKMPSEIVQILIEQKYEQVREQVHEDYDKSE